MNNSKSRRFSISLSFPGEYRNFVGKVADHLANTVPISRLLYDKYLEAEFARLDLDVYLPTLYRSESELVIIFLCPEYKEKRWCNLEWRSIKQLISTIDQDRIMLISFEEPGDLTDLGILRGDGFLIIGPRHPEEIATLILKRYEQNEGRQNHQSQQSAALSIEPNCRSIGENSGNVGIVDVVHLEMDNRNDIMASRQTRSTNRSKKSINEFNMFQPKQFSPALLDSISKLHITEHIRESILQVLSHPDYPRWMSVGGKLMRNPIWAPISNKHMEAMKMSHELNGPSPPTIMHLDMMLIRRNNKKSGRGELLTYFSSAWNTHLIRFRQWLPEDDPKQRFVMNNKKMAKHCDGVTGSVSVKRLPEKFAVSVKPHAEYGDLIIYIFEFCSVVFKSEPSFISDPEASEGLWFDLDNLRTDSSSWAVNADAISAIHKLFTVSLGPLPISYIDPRDVKNGRSKT